MDRSVLMGLVVLFMLALLGLMAWGWYGRRKRQRDVAAPVPVPVEIGAVLARLEGKYVATTEAGDRLDRLAVHGLGFRGDATLTVAEGGVLVGLSERDVWIPLADLRGIHRATWTIDRVVETDGLEVLDWTLGERPVESAFRMQQPKALETAVAQLLERRAA
ncbi:hypothetical protein PYV02_12060 [Leifsonia sp. H3M29-4]|uniref:PH-like domain-containing protein n=1 Tax=Salinibacterium metalliresistens TaxID=3031321 RepID=UPI0023D9A45A|nr:hypothetical protein [Salinibacterium metalliresistens]MDF1479815.1 hypothetical protein [Salinibacterium metalliresistens]